MRLQGLGVLVMGAGSVAEGWSNGKASAYAYAREGARVACADAVKARAEETAHAIEQQGGKAFAFVADATNETEVAAVVARAEAELGGLNVLHNNVGYAGTSGTPDQISLVDWNKEITLNLTSAYLGIRFAAPLMRKRGGGAIINISSLLAVRSLRAPNVGYAAAKAAVEAMTRSCAAAYGRDNIRVNCIRIGFSETPLVKLSLDARGIPEDQKEAAMANSRRKVPLRAEHTDPFDVAAAAVFLASSEAKHITGVVLNVDGGLECAPI
jgi:NAD(P)-dependent dehydrogenase (short-subunit alcohol dehydrogenase family)